ncbi:hypothetical protein C8A03DRAFT_19658 [Achaetomium macrosporum]|uniref:Zn(2)-C6 fungal-type domain-containing protein n=1 Tax=Achaetomium macrosporum TaxID=79813 RepID=A0AAN7C196_9PEZI|nr:hypothetical protein C8A03DRAFT_19658 [Achaetomium macrosporum]
MASQGAGLSDTGRFPTRARRQRRACVQCTSAKRKCGKEAPSCARCCEKCIVCSYPQRPNISSGNADRGAERDEGAPLALSSRPPRPHSSLPRATSGYPSSAATGSHCRWFLSAESWVLHHRCSSIAADDPPFPVGEETLPHFISKVKTWAADWVRDGHSPLMHKHLYSGWLSDCLQDCLTSLTAYNTASSDSAKATALRIIDDRVNRLMQSQPQPNNNDDDDDCDLNPSILFTTPTHLARTQALFIYQLIRLFDGDIRARAQAEQHITTLLTWAKQMVESARLDCACTDLLPLSPSPNPHQRLPPLPTGDMNMNMNGNPFALPRDPLLTAIPSLWRAWIQAESVRRVYTAAVYVQNVYDTLRRGWSVCPGTIAFTAQNGLWDAGSGYVWIERLRSGAAAAAAGKKVAGRNGGGAGMMGAGSGEIDEITVAVLEVTFGVESFEKWIR